MKKRALVVGIDKYQKLGHLKGCVNDARNVADKLTASEFGFDVQLLENADATRKSLRSAINTLLSCADFSLFYFAGHGLRTNINTFLATADSEWDDEGVDFGYLVNAVSRIAASNQTVVIILDCCHAGDASLETAGFLPMAASDMPFISGYGRVVMAACLGDQKAKESKVDGAVHGRFTSSLLEALSGNAADSDTNVTVSSVYEYVASALEKSGSQRPMLRGDQNGRIILGSGVAPAGNRKQAGTDYIKSEIVLEAEQHVSHYFDAIQKVALRDYESYGHREACQRLAPIIDWFQRQITNSSALLKDPEFRKYWTNVLQQYQQLSNITTGIVLEKGRVVGDRIGSGTFGTVWKIEDATQKDLCFKSYHATELRDTEKTARFARETLHK